MELFAFTGHTPKFSQINQDIFMYTTDAHVHLQFSIAGTVVCTMEPWSTASASPCNKQEGKQNTSTLAYLVGRVFQDNRVRPEQRVKTIGQHGQREQGEKSGNNPMPPNSLSVTYISTHAAYC